MKKGGGKKKRTKETPAAAKPRVGESGQNECALAQERKHPKQDISF